MGFFDGFKRIKDPVRGTAQVVSTTRPPESATSGNCRMHLVVTVPGYQAFTVDDSYIVKVKKWPSPGDSLPIEASQSEPRKFKILWDEVQSWEVEAAARAQQMAQMMNQPPGAPGAPGVPGTVPGQPLVMVNGSPATPEELPAASPAGRRRLPAGSRRWSPGPWQGRRPNLRHRVTSRARPTTAWPPSSGSRR
jgi:hypothetical protein